MILKELNKSLPLSLNYLDLNLPIDPNDLQAFFENYKQVELKKLLIKNASINRNNLDTDDILKVIKNFAKEKNLEFLAYGAGNYLSTKLVEEFQLFTKVIKYNDLVIRVSDIDGNLIIN